VLDARSSIGIDFKLPAEAPPDVRPTHADGEQSGQCEQRQPSDGSGGVRVQNADVHQQPDSGAELGCPDDTAQGAKAALGGDDEYRPAGDQDDADEIVQGIEPLTAEGRFDPVKV